MTIDEAIRSLRQDPRCADLVRDSYLGRDVVDSFRRFEASAEFHEVRQILGARLRGATLLDLGAGTGIASFAFSAAGASHVVAVEPDPSEEVGRGAMTRLGHPANVEVRDGVGEAIPLSDNSMDIVYCRQMLHHARDLDRVLAECQRVLKPGGLFLACREHVVDNESQKKAFLDSHPIHRLAGGENAFSLPQYLAAIAGGGFVLRALLGPWDSVINAFPVVRSSDELADYPARRLEERFGSLGRGVSRLPGVSALVSWRIRRPRPGRMYSFLCSKEPGADSGAHAGDGTR